MPRAFWLNCLGLRSWLPDACNERNMIWFGEKTWYSYNLVPKMSISNLDRVLPYHVKNTSNRAEGLRMPLGTWFREYMNPHSTVAVTLECHLPWKFVWPWGQLVEWFLCLLEGADKAKLKCLKHKYNIIHARPAHHQGLWHKPGKVTTKSPCL